MFLVYYGIILRYIMSKESKQLFRFFFLVILNMPPPKTPQGHLGFQWHGSILLLLYPIFCFHHGPNHQIAMKHKGFLLNTKMPNVNLDEHYHY